MVTWFKSFVASPFDDDMDYLDWFAFIGFCLLALIIWRMILGHLFEAMD